jgi:hypothetical protein
MLQEELSETKKRLDEPNKLLDTMVPGSTFAEATARCESLETQLADLKFETRRTIDEQRTRLSSLEAEKTQLLATAQVNDNCDFTARLRLA